MSIKEFIQSLSERLQSSANVKTVYGDPIVAEGKTIIPVARVAYGFGGGSGSRKMEGEGGEENEGGESAGSGGGGGVAASPVGVVEITPQETRFIPFEERRKLVLALMIGLFLGLFIGRRRSRS